MSRVSQVYYYQTKLENFTPNQLASACEIASRLTDNPSLKAALLEAAKKLKPKKSKQVKDDEKSSPA